MILYLSKKIYYVEVFLVCLQLFLQRREIDMYATLPQKYEDILQANPLPRIITQETCRQLTERAPSQSI